MSGNIYSEYQGSLEIEAARNAGLALIRAAGMLSGFLGERRAADGLTLTQFLALEALWRGGPLCQNELAEKLMVTGPNITRVIDVLEEAGLVERVRSRQDRRYVMVTLTEEGQRRVAGIFPQHMADVASALSSLSLSEQEQLMGLCERLT